MTDPNTPKVDYTIIYQGVGKKWDIPLVGDIMTTFGQPSVHHQNDSTQTTLTFTITGDARAAIVNMCYKHLSDISFKVLLSETIASYTV